MNANETIFALALASNLDPEQHFQTAYQTIQSWGEAQFSHVYQIPCRDGVGADYWNSACLLKTSKSRAQLELELKQLEADSGRVRPSHQISLDVDLIAWGNNLNEMRFNLKKCRLLLMSKFHFMSCGIILHYTYLSAISLKLTSKQIFRLILNLIYLLY